MRVIKEKDGTTFIVFDDFEELKGLFMEVYRELEYENSNKNLSLDK
jgi:hypothetical protein